jgi:CBS domain-containing protein
MQIEQVMTRSVDTVVSGASISEAANRMKQIDAGFLPVTDKARERLVGVATDRDIVVRCIAEGRDPADTPIDEAMSEKVLYCFADDEVEQAAHSMATQQVYRLVVLDGRESKRLAGILTMSDIRRQGSSDAAQLAADRVVEAA